MNTKKLFDSPKTLSSEEIASIADLINKNFEKANKSISIKTDEIDPLLSKLEDKNAYFVKILDTKTNQLRCFFEDCAPSISKSPFQLYHFYSEPDWALDAIINKHLKVFNLEAQNDNDNSELFEFYKRMGVFNFPEIQTARKNTFIYCFTPFANSEKMWKEYANGDMGVCLEFQFKLKEKHDCFDLRNVFYDNGYDLDFISDTVFSVFRKTNYFINIPGHHDFAPFYKRDKYKGERESRLSLYYHEDMELFGAVHDLGKSFFLSNFPESEVSGKRFIKIGLSNKFFDIIISNVFYGKKCDSSKVSQLTEACRVANIEIQCREIT